MLLSSYTTRHAGWDLYLPLHNLFSTFSVYARHFDEQILHSTGVDYSCNCVYGLISVKTWCLGVSTCDNLPCIEHMQHDPQTSEICFSHGIMNCWERGKETLGIPCVLMHDYFHIKILRIMISSDTIWLMFWYFIGLPKCKILFLWCD